MIEAEQLSLSYGDVKAVCDVSFRIERSEIVGLLGHNGAGKTTIMKMLTGYLDPSAGHIMIDGFDITTHRHEIQRRIGYLPENCPLYPDMTVIDYLEYQASLQGVQSAERAAAIREAIGATGLDARAMHRVATLSRGYRQRVGVARAILHKPRIIILDEPTNGLDPSQIQHMRALIHSLAQHATVLLSTHILQEVEAVCTRVLMLRQGRLALDAKLSELGQAQSLVLSVGAAPKHARLLLGSVCGVERIEEIGAEQDRYSYRLALGPSDPGEFACAIGRAMHENGIALYRLQPEIAGLETVFREINDAEEVVHA
ncbi:MAG: ABC transporter ATP-binding protein [Nitrococcus sp.]|nr:ABC transporter ATP-binding protein [Nitrococcus sp.]